ncbi:DNA ligase 4-like, partial [Musca vetustissima]|uniref:DNA ligase 4-like n=1 Tax=Musca vetustissima TaxID=27455 RepID=UPI002AB6761B
NMEISETIKFRDICSLLNRVSKTNNKDKKCRIIKQYYASFCKHRERFREEQKMKPDMPEDGRSSFYCILRCLIPKSDNAREPYGLQVPTLGRVYIKVLQLSSQSKEAELLEARNFCSIRGDYAERVYRILKPRCSNSPSDLTLKEVHDMLDSVASENLLNTENVLTKLSQVASAEEQMWFVRLLLKSMQLSIAEQRIFDLLHEQAKAMYQACANLSKLCCHLADNKFTLVNGNLPQLGNGPAPLVVDITPFEHIRPQLCEVFPGNMEHIMASDVLYMETKMDGERFQLHYNEGRFKYISRNGIDYTNSFGSSYDDDNKLTMKLKHLLPIDMQSIILDGEMMIWDRLNQKYREKGENTDVKHLKEDRNWQPCFVVYDLLYWNGQNLLGIPYIQRMYKLRNLLREQEGVLQLMKSEKILSVEDFRAKFQQALDQHAEGVVLKKQNAVYRPGCRNGGGWYKVKADYIDGLTTEFDLLVIGGFYNRSRTFVESFLVGVLKYISHQQFEVYSVGKVSNCTQQRVLLNNTLKSHWHLLSQEQPPIWYHYRHTSAEGRPDVWIEPRNSVILQIKATDLNPSGAFALNMCLHFPRIQMWRNDKAWHECLSLEEYQQLKSNSNGGGGIKKIVKRNVSLEDFIGNQSKRRKMTPAEKRKLGLLTYEKQFDPSNVEKTSQLFEGFSVCILSAALNRRYTAQYLKSLVVQNGGTIVENPLPNNPSCIVVAGDISIRVQALCKSQKYDIVSMDWLLRACEKQRIKITPLDFICTTAEVKEKFAEVFDKYGDHYTEFVRSKHLKRICDAMIVDDVPDLDDEALNELENLIYPLKNINFFRNKNAYFYSIEPDSIHARLNFQWHGGNVIDDRNLEEAELNPDEILSKISYIFINLLQFDKGEFLPWLHERFSAQHLSHIQIVSIRWILDSHKARMLHDIKEYTWHDFD